MPNSAHRLIALVAISFSVLACQRLASAGAQQKRLAILPVEAVNLPPKDATAVEKRLWQAVSARKRYLLVSKTTVTAALSARPDGCAREVSCLRRTGKQLRADVVLTLRVGRLGETTVLQLTAYDVARGARAGSWEEILRTESMIEIKRALDRMVDSFVPAEVVRRRPWYRRWWVWTTAAAVVAGSVALTIALTTANDSERGPDRVVIPPPP